MGGLLPHVKPYSINPTGIFKPISKSTDAIDYIAISSKKAQSPMADKTMTLPQIIHHFKERAIAQLLRRLGATSTETNTILRRNRLMKDYK